nr:hypothetical protein [Tanacetum cinerariifolium]
MSAIILVGLGELMGYFGGIQVAQKKVKIAFENADSSSRVELIPSKIKYAITVVLSFHNEFSEAKRNQEYARETKRNDEEYELFPKKSLKTTLLNVPAWFLLHKLILEDHYGHQHVHSPGLLRKLMPTKMVKAYEDQDLVFYNDQKEPLLGLSEEFKLRYLKPENRTRVSWNGMILYTQNVQEINALNHFRLLKVKNIEADSFTMVSIISFVAELSILRQSKWIHGVITSCCLDKNVFIKTTLVDISGRLTEAWDIILNMPVKPQTKNVKLGEMVGKKLFELNPSDGGYYVLLVNIYDSASMWEIKSKIEERRIRKTPGYSSVDLENEVHTFYSGSSWHYPCKEIYDFLETLIDNIKDIYCLDADGALFDAALFAAPAAFSY